MEHTTNKYVRDMKTRSSGKEFLLATVTRQTLAWVRNVTKYASMCNSMLRDHYSEIFVGAG
ncbi:hypothetical protein DPMN_192354 [Dreissena polymorpha]|uniref:Uncharacterized protein n=1 Tax=Dreissena polymorpha TaxID=45954 RepID=A0A9D4BE14_DREPO|nr:hypothetical protein DPMN_192354 [Dreissena polymorpha]